MRTQENTEIKLSIRKARSLTRYLSLLMTIMIITALFSFKSVEDRKPTTLRVKANIILDYSVPVDENGDPICLLPWIEN